MTELILKQGGLVQVVDGVETLLAPLSAVTMLANSGSDSRITVQVNLIVRVAENVQLGA